MKDKIIYALIAVALAVLLIAPINIWASQMNLETGSRVDCSNTQGECWKNTYRIPEEFGSDLDGFLAENPDAQPVERLPITRY